ncbi:hypothetical protein BROUX41_003176 [Berkeleyomyces rouxiae]|uniref:uncharacterized protein n=1 Tax=Berkeleyomyces rouxiae TaxID=2035830 RepID=UPI003B7B5305
MRPMTSAPVASPEMPQGLPMPFGFDSVDAMAPAHSTSRYPCMPQQLNNDKDFTRWDQDAGVSEWAAESSLWGSAVDTPLDMSLDYRMDACLGITSPTLSTMSFGTTSGMPNALFSPLSLLSEAPNDLPGQMSLLPTPSTTPVSIVSISSSGQIFPAPSNTPVRSEPVAAPPPPPPPPSMPLSLSSVQRPSNVPTFSVSLPLATPESVRTPATEPMRKTPTAKRVGTNHCETCGKRFQRISELSKHRRYHLKDHKCAHAGCEAAFSTRKDLKRHVNSAHSTSKTGHVCRMPGCGKNVSRKVYNRSDNFLRHLRTAHFHDNIDVTEALRTWLDDRPGSKDTDEAE